LAAKLKLFEAGPVNDPVVLRGHTPKEQNHYEQTTSPTYNGFDDYNDGSESKAAL